MEEVLNQDLVLEMHCFYQSMVDKLSQINWSHYFLFFFGLGCFQSSSLELILKWDLEEVEGVFTLRTDLQDVHWHHVHP